MMPECVGKSGGNGEHLWLASFALVVEIFYGKLNVMTRGKAS
jgi:hypothetical protein